MDLDEDDDEIVWIGSKSNVGSHLLDHNYSKTSTENVSLKSVGDTVLKYVFKAMNLKERTIMERVCSQWCSIVNIVAHMTDFYPTQLDTCYVPPKLDVTELSDAYLSLFKKCPGFKRFTTEYIDPEYVKDPQKMTNLCQEIAELRPDVSELVIETRSSERGQPQRGIPVDMAKKLLQNLKYQQNTNHISSLIVYTEDWGHLSKSLLPSILGYVEKVTSMTIIFTSKYPDDIFTHHMVPCWIVLAPTLTKLKLIWKESPLNFGFESILVNLKELTFKPSSDQLIKTFDNMRNLTKLSFVGDLSLVQTLVENSFHVRSLVDITWIDNDKKSDDDFQVFYDKNLFTNESNDRRVEAKRTFDQFFYRFGPRLKVLHFTVHQLNILGKDLLSNMYLCKKTLMDIKLDFHRRCDINLVQAVQGMPNLRKVNLGFRNPIDHLALIEILKSCTRLRKINVGLLYQRKDGDEEDEEPSGDEDSEVELSSSEDELEDGDMDEELSDEEDDDYDQEVQIDSDDGQEEGEPLSKEDQIKTYAVDALCRYGSKFPKRYIVAKLTAQFPCKNKYQASFQKNIIMEEVGVTDGRVVIDLLNPKESD